MPKDRGVKSLQKLLELSRKGELRAGRLLWELSRGVGADWLGGGTQRSASRVGTGGD